MSTVFRKSVEKVAVIYLNCIGLRLVSFRLLDFLFPNNYPRKQSERHNID